jgi:hypothetical protein
MSGLDILNSLRPLSRFPICPTHRVIIVFVELFAFNLSLPILRRIGSRLLSFLQDCFLVNLYTLKLGLIYAREDDAVALFNLLIYHVASVKVT